MKLINYFNNLKISAKLLVGYTLLFFVIISGTLYLSYLFVKQSLEDQIHDQLKASTENFTNLITTAASASIENFLRAKTETNLKLTEELYDEFLKGRMTEESAKRRASDFILTQNIGPSGYIYVTDSKGTAVVHPKGEVEGENFIDHEFVRQQIILKKGFIEYDWKNPEDSVARSKVLYMEYFEPWDWIISVTGYKDEFNSLVDPKDLKKQVLSIKLGEEGYSFLINTSGDILVHPFIESANYLNLTDADGNLIIRQILEEKSGILYYNWFDPDALNPRQKIVLFNYIPEFNWIICTSGYLEEFYTPLVYLQRIFILSLFLTILIIVPLTYWLSNTITKPLQKLTLLFSGVSQGEISTEMLEETKDEIGRLSHYYNQFIQKMSEYDYSLQTATTERKKAEGKIIESEKRLRNILTTMGEGYIEINNAGTIVDVNPNLCKLLLLKREQIIGNQLTSFLDLEASEIVKHQLALRENKESSSYVITIDLPGSDKTLHLLNNATPILNDAGEKTGSFALVTDVTELVNKEKEIERLNLHLENKTKELSQIIQVTSQDLKTALINIQGFNSELEDAVQKLLEHIENNYNQQSFPEHIKELVNSDIPSFSQILNANILKIDSMISGLLRLAMLGKDQIEKEKIDLNILINQIISPFKTDIEEQNILVTIEDLPDIMGDAKLISFLFHNLIENAIKFQSLERKGEIVINGNIIDDAVIISVSDNGVGIEEYNLKKIFEIFHRLDPDLSTGSGLGLTMVNKIAGLHFGKVWVESVYGEGSTFFVSLPKN